MIAHKGIRGNAVAPRPIRTPMIPSMMPEESRIWGAGFWEQAAQPAELTTAYVLLADPPSSSTSEPASRLQAASLSFRPANPIWKMPGTISWMAYYATTPIPQFKARYHAPCTLESGSCPMPHREPPPALHPIEDF